MGRAASGVLSRPRDAPGVLFVRQIGTERTPEQQAITALQDTVRRGENERSEILSALGEALDGWERRAGKDELATIADLRRRWGVGGDDATPDDK